MIIAFCLALYEKSQGLEVLFVLAAIVGFIRGVFDELNKRG